MKNLTKILAGAVAAGTMAVSGVAPVHAKGGDSQSWGRDYRHPDNYRYGLGYRMHPDQAVRLCARAAEREVSRYGYGRADATRITGVSRKDGGFNVKGRILVNSRGHGWRHQGIDRGRFSCKVRYGRVADISLSGLRGYY